MKEIKKIMDKIQSNYETDSSRLKEIKQLLNVKDNDKIKERKQQMYHYVGKVDHTWNKNTWEEMKNEIKERRP